METSSTTNAISIRIPRSLVCFCLRAFATAADLREAAEDPDFLPEAACLFLPAAVLFREEAALLVEELLPVPVFLRVLPDAEEDPFFLPEPPLFLFCAMYLLCVCPRENPRGWCWCDLSLNIVSGHTPTGVWP